MFSPPSLEIIKTQIILIFCQVLPTLCASLWLIFSLFATVRRSARGFREEEWFYQQINVCVCVTVWILSLPHKAMFRLMLTFKVSRIHWEKLIDMWILQGECKESRKRRTHFSDSQSIWHHWTCFLPGCRTTFTNHPCQPYSIYKRTPCWSFIRNDLKHMMDATGGEKVIHLPFQSVADWAELLSN